MNRRPRIFPSRLSRSEGLVYRGATLFFLALFAALVWPVYPLFAGIRPRVLGVPLSLAYVVGLLLLGFAVLLALFVWEGRRRGPDETSRERAGASPSTTTPRRGAVPEGGKGIEGSRG